MRKKVLKDNVLKLRPYRHSDIPLIVEAIQESMAEGKPWLPFFFESYSRDDAELFIRHAERTWKKGTEYNFAITDKETGAFLGGAGINQINTAHRFANLGYWVRTGSTGRSVAPAAARLVAWFAFEEIKLQRVELLIQPENSRSARVADKLNARREGVLRNRLWIHKKSCDALMYSLIPEDLQLGS